MIEFLLQSILYKQTGYLGRTAGKKNDYPHGKVKYTKYLTNITFVLSTHSSKHLWDQTDSRTYAACRQVSAQCIWSTAVLLVRFRATRRGRPALTLRHEVRPQKGIKDACGIRGRHEAELGEEPKKSWTVGGIYCSSSESRESRNRVGIC